MTPERFERLVAAYGAEPALWPAGEREAALALLADHPRLQQVLDAERALDGALRAWTLPPVPARLRDGVLATAPKERGRWPAAWGRRGLWISGAGLAAACAAGVVVGAGVIGPSLLGAGTGGHIGFMADDISFLGAPLDAGTPR
jgi:hypothetical protein